MDLEKLKTAIEKSMADFPDSFAKKYVEEILEKYKHSSIDSPLDFISREPPCPIIGNRSTHAQYSSEQSIMLCYDSRRDDCPFSHSNSEANFCLYSRICDELNNL